MRQEKRQIEETAGRDRRNDRRKIQEQDTQGTTGGRERRKRGMGGE